MLLCLFSQFTCADIGWTEAAQNEQAYSTSELATRKKMREDRNLCKDSKSSFLIAVCKQNDDLGWLFPASLLKLGQRHDRSKTSCNKIWSWLDHRQLTTFMERWQSATPEDQRNLIRHFPPYRYHRGDGLFTRDYILPHIQQHAVISKLYRK